MAVHLATGPKPRQNARAHPPEGICDPRGANHAGALSTSEHQSHTHTLTRSTRTHSLATLTRSLAHAHSQHSPPSLAHTHSRTLARAYDAFCQGGRKGDRHPKCYRSPFRPPPFSTNAPSIDILYYFAKGGEGASPPPPSDS